MQVEIKIDEGAKEPRAIILTASITEEINSAVAFLTNLETEGLLTGVKNDCMEIVDTDSIIRIYALNGKVAAKTENGEYIMRQRLYELEERLKQKMFVRISNSEIINLKKVKSFDLSLAGTVCVQFKNGETTYASRRYVPQIKKKLNL